MRSEKEYREIVQALRYGNKNPYGVKAVAGLVRANPELADWWAEAEAASRASKPLGARFRKDRPGYAEIKAAVLAQQNFDFPDENRIDCFCMEDAA